MRLLLCVAAVCGAIAAPALASPVLPLSHAGRWITDATGRVVVMHGTNMVYKVAPFYPGAAPFGASDAAFLRSIDFTAVRVGILWEALEPEPGVYNDVYLDHIADTVGTLASYGIVSLLDFHQDQYNEQFAGEGFPSWAVEDDGLPNTDTAFPDGYLVNPALQRAYENFWADEPGPGGVGLQERYAAAWQHVAEHFRGDPSVLGYEIMNEPFPGSDYLTCATSSGCPGSDAQLTALEHKVDGAIRSVDPRTLVFYEPFVTFDFGYQDYVGALDDPRAVFAWHDYCLYNTSPAGCSSNVTSMQNAAAHVSQTGEGTFMTEYGGTSTAPFLEKMVALADSYMVPWTEWSYCTCEDPTGSSDEGMVLDPAKPKTPPNLRTSIVDSIVEPYPQVVAGTPLSWGYDRSTSRFSLSYSTSRAAGDGSFRAGSVSEVATPKLDYPSGYAARATGGAIVSAHGAPVLKIVSCPGVSTITVTVTPTGRSSGTCRLRLRIRVHPHAVALGQPTTYHFSVTARLGSFAMPVANARISFDGHTVRTNRRGRASIRLLLVARVRPYTAIARAPGYIVGRRRLRA